MPLAEAQARVRQGGPDARARPARTPAAPPSAGSWPPATPARCAPATAAPRDLVVGHARGALRRHAREERRQGDQERGRLRHRQAVRRLVRDARARSWRCRCGCTRCAPDTATAVGRGEQPGRARARRARHSAQSPLEQHGPRRAWDGGRGTRARALRGRGRRARRPRRPRSCCAPEGLATEIVDEDEPLWDEQRAAQRGPLVVKVSGLPTRLARPRCAPPTSSAARWWAARRSACRGCASRSRPRRPWSGCGATSSAASCRTARPISTSTRPAPLDPAASALMRRVKERFDPAGVCV